MHHVRHAKEVDGRGSRKKGIKKKKQERSQGYTESAWPDEQEEAGREEEKRKKREERAKEGAPRSVLASPEKDGCPYLQFIL